MCDVLVARTNPEAVPDSSDGPISEDVFTAYSKGRVEKIAKSFKEKTAFIQPPTKGDLCKASSPQPLQRLLGSHAGQAGSVLSIS